MIELDARTASHLAWPLLAACCVCALGAVVGAWGFGIGWQLLLLSAAVGVTIVSIRVTRVRPVYGLVVIAAVVYLITVGSGRSPSFDVSWPIAVGDAVISLGFVGALALATARRIGRPTLGDLVELLLVAHGSALATWVFLTNPLLERGVPTALAVVASSTVPLATVLATYMVDLWSDGLLHNRGVLLIALAGVAFLVAALLSRLQLVDAADPVVAVAPTACYTISTGLMLGGLLQPDIREIDRAPSGCADHEVRLFLIGTAVLAPATLLAVVPPDGALDTTLRVVGTLLLVALVVTRLAIAVRDHALASERLRMRAYLDDLTGLPTRTRFVDIVGDALDATWRSERHPTIVQLNLDRFKNINDSFGHYSANEVLQRVADRLREVAGDFGAVAARVGGDDFAVLDASTTSIDDAEELIDAIRNALAAPFTIDDSNVFLTASIGVAIAPSKRSLGAEEFLRRSDIATHRAKTDGANRVVVFDESMQVNVAHRMDVEHALHGAVGRQEMRLYHQPIVDIVTGRVTGFEALMRWDRNDGAVVSPATFIPIAEDTGMICELGRWALHEALRELRGWIDDGVVDPTTTMSVNVSPRQIADADFSDIVRQALGDTGVPPHLLWIEMTESMMLDEPELAQTTLREIRSMGVRLALDDFGTGFSSLSLLQKFPIQRIKIDRAFVHGIADNTNDRSLVRTIVAMARSMGLDLVAEGVETVHQLQELRQLGCDKAQGYLISHPVPAPAMRSTMSALSELASLSLFDNDDRDATGAPLDDAPRRTSLPVRAEPAPGQHVGTGLVGRTSSRPLGQPVI